MRDLLEFSALFTSILVILRAYAWAWQPEDFRSIPWPRWCDPFCLIEDFGK